MASKRKLKELAKELRKRHIPQGTIWDLDSLADNFIYSLLINSDIGQEIEGMSVIELSQYLQKRNLVNDYDVLELILGTNYKEEEDGKEV